MDLFHPHDASSESGTDKTPDLQVDESTDTTWETASSNVYEADFSSYAPSVEWPQRKMRPAGYESPVPSVYSFHESLDGHLFRDHSGRTYNAKSDAYLLPADTEEHERLDLQHVMLQIYLGGLYPAKELVEKLLRPRDGESPMILDVGTGSGAWAVDMAKRFPHCEVIGIDLVPPKIQDGNIPDNCRFEVDDCNLSFTHWISTFDLIHVRGMNGGVHDFQLFLYNMAQIMKPGAIIILGTGMLQFYDENGQPYPDVNEGEKGFSWLQKWFTELRTDYIKATSASSNAACHGLDAPWFWDQWAANNPNFKDVFTWKMNTQLGNWSTGLPKDIHHANELCRTNIINLMKSYAPVLSPKGGPSEQIERWTKEATKELEELRVHSLGEWRWLWCTRTDTEWIPKGAEEAPSS